MSHPTKTMIAGLLGALVLAAAPGVARAGVLASSYLISGNAVRMACRVVNVGQAPIKVTAAKILLPSGYSFTESESCVGLLQPGQNCTIVTSGQDLAGYVRVEGSTKHLRGTCMLLTAVNNVLAVTEMR